MALHNKAHSFNELDKAVVHVIRLVSFLMVAFCDCGFCWIFEKAREFQKNIYFCFIDYAKAFDSVAHHKLWKILKGMGIPDHLTCVMRNLYACQEATLRTGHGTTHWFQIGKGYILWPCLFNLYAEYIMRNAELGEAQLESRFQREISITWDMQMTPL